MGFFNRDHSGPPEVKEAVARLAALSLTELGDYVLRAGWTEDPGKDLTAGNLATMIDPQGVGGDLDDAHKQLCSLVEEGIQALEHAGLVMPHFEPAQTGRLFWRVTRAGRVALGAPAAMV